MPVHELRRGRLVEAAGAGRRRRDPPSLGCARRGCRVAVDCGRRRVAGEAPRSNRALHLSDDRHAGRRLARRLGCDPGARGCTPHTCAFRDLHAELKGAGASAVFGLSTQTLSEQQDDRRAPASAVPAAVRCWARLDASHDAADDGGRRQDDDQAPRDDHRRRHASRTSSTRCFRPIGTRPTFSLGSGEPEMSAWPYPAPVDDGAARHLVPGLRMPDVSLPSTRGGETSVARLPDCRAVRLSVDRATGSLQSAELGLTFPGAHGSTPEAEGFRDLDPSSVPWTFEFSG